MGEIKLSFIRGYVLNSLHQPGRKGEGETGQVGLLAAGARWKTASRSQS